ncbi:MAG: FdtA/QdtA family cupin domain-containing protein [Campylobacter lanienae]|uniref:sugar 3,4-ketoisomerase n=1 Tax=Campylobacter TaxID=194 RepID=UPI000A33FC24|nr:MULTISPECIES: FdtA/QdtA family cupin domain-containing protein [Campylobacter]MCI5540257.1 FdtA/QdtA family cupin domain-containing protein [Campylobacter lanienae]
MNYKILNFNVIGDGRGKLVSLESLKNIPFDIKRVYYIYDTNTEPRGFHAHTKLEQVVVALAGSCEFELDDGKNKEIIKLNSPNIGLYIGVNMWRIMRNFSNDCRLMVLASDYYNESEYIRDYNEFLKVANDS